MPNHVRTSLPLWHFLMAGCVAMTWCINLGWTLYEKYGSYWRVSCLLVYTMENESYESQLILPSDHHSHLDWGEEQTTQSHVI